MKRGYLSEYFEGVAVKRLSAVDIDVTRSHQHEIGAVKAMYSTFMGIPQSAEKWPALFIFMDDESDDPLTEEVTVTYYDVRAKNPERNPEPRFYFPTTQVTQCASIGDLLVIAKCRDGRLLFIFAENGSSAARQVEWLFGFSDDLFPTFSVRSELETEQDKIGFAATFILENIGIEVTSTEESFLDIMLRRFGRAFPKTREFSEFARSTLTDIDPREDPDGALMAWMEREEILFRTLERHLLGDWLQNITNTDIDDVIKTTLSVQNRRKSRVGHALENHFEVILKSFQVQYNRGATTENRAKPDFLFPGHAEYHDPNFSVDRLTMLGVKSTCKDRWRQVLSEADRIPKKHLLTLESAISTNQTDEMKAKNLQLIVPGQIFDSYSDEQQAWLMTVKEFIGVVRVRQVLM